MMTDSEVNIFLISFPMSFEALVVWTMPKHAIAVDRPMAEVGFGKGFRRPNMNPTRVNCRFQRQLWTHAPISLYSWMAF